MSGFLAVCVRLSLHRGKGWKREVNFCGRINKREIVSKWFLCCLCLVFSETFVHDCKTVKCFPNQEEQKLGQIRAKSKNGQKFDIRRLCSQPFNCFPSILNLFLQLMHLFRKDFQRNIQHSIKMLDITKRNSNVHFILGKTGHV